MNTEQERAELLPCPFCGGDHLKLFGESAPEWWVCCETCKAATQTRTNKSQAIEDWNRRAALQSQDREVARWLVFNVGCIECGVSSDVVGVFATEEEAERVAAICSEALSWREGGQNSFEVFDLQSEQASEYSKAIDHARRIEGERE